jgi:hypothetical protein
MIYTVDDMLAMLTQIKAQHGGAIPVVIKTSESRSAYENASVDVIRVALHTDNELGELFVADDNGIPAVAIV